MPAASFHIAAGVAGGHVREAEAASLLGVAQRVLAGLAPSCPSRRGPAPETGPRKQAWSAESAQLGQKESAGSAQHSCPPPSI